MCEGNKLGVGLMARAPECGRVKTRLAADIGVESATAVYVELLENVSDTIIGSTRELCGDSVSFNWFADPEESIPGLSERFSGFDSFAPQKSGDLGARMQEALGDLLERYKFAALIGADIPDISAKHIEATLLGLEDSDVVLGPTYDGGYYLIGVRQMYRELFIGIPWSATNTFEKTVAACKSANLSYHLLETLSDLDVVADFERIKWRPKSVRIKG